MIFWYIFATQNAKSSTAWCNHPVWSLRIACRTNFIPSVQLPNSRLISSMRNTTSEELVILFTYNFKITLVTCKNLFSRVPKKNSNNYFVSSCLTTAISNITGNGEISLFLYDTFRKTKCNNCIIGKLKLMTTIL